MNDWQLTAAVRILIKRFGISRADIQAEILEMQKEQDRETERQFNRMIAAIGAKPIGEFTIGE